MKFIVEREKLLKPLQQVSSPLTARPAQPVLGNILIQVNQGFLSLTGTDLELELIIHIELTQPCEPGTTTVPARKFLDICRGLPENALLAVTLDNDRLLIQSGRSRFSLATLSANQYPNMDDWQSDIEFSLPQITLKRLIENTQFAMAHQDVRYYLNGLMLETEGNTVRTVTTDGHRLAICTIPVEQNLPTNSIIIPRKGIIEMVRLLETDEQPIHIKIGSNNIRLHIGNIIFTSKLIDGRFPDYRRVLPKNPSKIVEAECEVLKQAFSRAAILSNEKFRGVRLFLTKNQLRITANNPEQEEAEEIVDVSYTGDDLEIGFNVNYILDVLNVLKCQRVKLLLNNAITSVQIEDCASQNSLYVVMPMRL